MAAIKKKHVAPPPEDDTDEEVEPDDRRGAPPAVIDPTHGMEDYLRACVRIDPLDIQGEYIRIPADLAYWNDRYAEALRVFLGSEIEVKLIRAQMEPQIREMLLNAGGKTTEAQVKAAIDSDENVIDAQRRNVEAEVEKNRHYGILDAIRSKKEMLISLGAHIRVEMAGDPLIRDMQRAASGRG